MAPGSRREHGFTKMAEEHEQIAQAIERRRQHEQTKQRPARAQRQAELGVAWLTL
jgi:hypothetical protein